MNTDYSTFVSENDQYNKDPKLKREDVVALQNWMAKEAHLPKISELKLIFFLHSNYYNIESAKQCIENYYTIKANCPDIFGHYDVNKQAVKNTNKMMLINTAASTAGHRVVILHIMDKNVDLMQIGAIFFLCDLMTHLSYVQNGIHDNHIVVINGANARFAHVLKVSVIIAKIFLMYVQTALPIRLKAIHVVNVSPAMEKLYAMCRPFIKGELLNSIHMHTNVQDLQKHLPKDCIPKDLCGDGPSFKDLQEDQQKRTDALAKYIYSHGMEKADESKRLKKIDINDMFGFEGTFKRLEID